MSRLVHKLLCLFALTPLAFAQFQFQRSTLPTHSFDVLHADFNHDGRPDIVTLSSAGNVLKVLLNSGGGAFGTPRTLSLAADVVAFAVGDIDRDGNADIVVCSSTATDGTLSFFISNGDGSFKSRVDRLGHPNCAGLAIADFNKDAKTDVAMGWWDFVQGEGRNNHISVFSDFANNGEEIVSSHLGPTIGDPGVNLASIKKIAAADFNLDGKTDIVFAQFVEDQVSGTVAIAQNDGAGHFSTVFTDSKSFNPLALAVGDLDQDGRPDVFTVTQTDPDGASTAAFAYRNRGGAPVSFTRQDIARETTGAEIRAVSVADLNNDGVKELAVLEDRPDASGNLRPNLLLLHASAVGFQKVGSFVLSGTTSFDSSALTVADFSRDTKLDLVLAADSDIVLKNVASIATCIPGSQLRTIKVCININKHPLVVRANVNDNREIHLMKIYVDHKAVFSTIDDRIVKGISMSAGKHVVTVKAWDDLGPFSATLNVTAP